MSAFKRSLKRMLPEKVQDIIRLVYFPSMRYAFFPGPLTFNKDGLATSHNCDFMEDAPFKEAYALGKRTGSWSGSDLRWRAHVVCWAAQRAKNLEGDFVECGVNKGGYARMIVHYLNFSTLPKTFYLLDTFKGLADQYISDAERRMGKRAGGYEECYEQVQRTFAPFPNVKLIRGPVPDTLPQVKASKVSYLSIDMNNAIPERAAAEFFWDKLVSGAVMLLDDYGQHGYITQKQTFDDFARCKNVPLLCLPTGQGMIIKP